MSQIKTESIRADFPASGIRVREYFAAIAMQAYAGADHVANSGVPYQHIAKWSVDMADALILELNKETK